MEFKPCKKKKFEPEFIQVTAENADDLCLYLYNLGVRTEFTDMPSYREIYVEKYKNGKTKHATVHYGDYLVIKDKRVKWMSKYEFNERYETKEENGSES